MGWLYAPGSEGWSLDSTSPLEIHTEPLVTLSTKVTRRPFSWRGWKTRPWIARLSGTISKPSMADQCAEEWILSLRDSRASRTASPESRRVTLTIEPCGPSLSESSRSASLDSSSSRTSQASEGTLSLFGESFEDWVSSGLRHSYRPPASAARHISASDSLLLLPTTTASNYGSNRGGRIWESRPGEAEPRNDSLQDSDATCVRLQREPWIREKEIGTHSVGNAPPNADSGRLGRQRIGWVFDQERETLWHDSDGRCAGCRTCGTSWATESPILRVDAGPPHRMDELRAIGNVGTPPVVYARAFITLASSLI